VATGLLIIVGILVGMTGCYAATYQTKTAPLASTPEFAYMGYSQNSSISVAANETFIV
jgi:hypothetical protein